LIPRSELAELSAEGTADRLAEEGVSAEVMVRSGPAERVAIPR